MANEAQRYLRKLVFKYDPALPITDRRADIATALKENQVIIVAGDTGSGKSTQLPQICLELGLGSLGLIAHTQPRRLAARALAARIAEELGESVGMTVGFRVRFADRVSAATRLVLMTDGLLLAELGSDPTLRRYDTLIVDEAHERTLNIDLLLGVLKRLLPRRPDLKLVVTSATLDVERMARFFGGAPIISVSGRSHPIEVRYAAPAEDALDPDLPLAVLAAYQDVATSPTLRGGGDVLVFLPGEREIRDVGEFLERELDTAVDVLALYSRLAWEQQSKIFQRGARPRIVLATNVAETSITVPGVRAVIDSGLARVSRYSPRNRLQRLPIEPISRASAEQRKGRCGRLGPGLCIRLYSEAEFEARPAFTEPEVLRTNLAALLLRLAADGLGAAEDFPFIDAPDSRALGDGYRLLQELQAIDAERRITQRGRAMARLPLDPRLGRALLESKRFHAESELLAIVAGLSVPDARIASADGANEDPTASAAFEDHKSEFSALVKLWRAYRQARQGSRRDLRRWCKERGLSLLRLSEWDDVYAQVAERARDLGIVPQVKPASYTGVHRALLAGFCTMVGSRGEEGVYLGTRGVHFHLLPGSPLKRRRPRWVMAANIVETSRVFARRVADIEPNWIEAAAQHLLKREFLEPDWDEVREAVVARERISFLGLILSANRVVNFGPIAPEESRRIFAREALVYQRLARRPAWLLANDAAILAAQRLEERLRTRDLLRPAEVFVEFYERTLPRQVSSTATLDYFTRHLSEAERTALALTPDDIYARAPDPEQLRQFPDNVLVSSLRVPVDYAFAPGEPRDGATLQIPLLAVPLLTQAGVDAAVPGLVGPHIEALLRSLPKEVRRALIPIAGTAQSFIDAMGAPTTDAVRLAAWLSESRGVPPAQLRFDKAAVPAHLVPRVAVLGAGRPGAAADGLPVEGRDLGALRRRFAASARLELDRRAQQDFPLPWRRFEASELAATQTLDLGEGTLTVHPTLRPDADAVVVRFDWSHEEAEQHFVAGAVFLARLMLERPVRDLRRQIAADSRLLLAVSPFLNGAALAELLLHWTVASACFDDAVPPRERTAFEAAVERGRGELCAAFDAAVTGVSAWCTAGRAVRATLDEPRARAHLALAQATQSHLRQLMQPDSYIFSSITWRRQLPRYIKAEERRWQRLFARGGESADIARELDEWTLRIEQLAQRVAAEQRWIKSLGELQAWFEEYRISLYAQELRTLGPISAGRLSARAAQIDGWLRR